MIKTKQSATYFLFIILGILPFSLKAQNYTVEPNPISKIVDLEVTSNDFEIVAEAIITNNTAEPLNLRWVRIVNNKPDCWETSVFGVMIQAAPFVDSLEFDLDPGQKGSLNVSVFTYSGGTGPNEGEAEVVLKIVNLNELADTLLVPYSFDVTGGLDCTLSSFNTEKVDFSIFPNPAQEYFQISDVEEIETIHIYNAQGKRVGDYRVLHNGRYDISNLDRGIYIIKFLSLDMWPVATRRLSLE